MVLLGLVGLALRQHVGDRRGTGPCKARAWRRPPTAIIPDSVSLISRPKVKSVDLPPLVLAIIPEKPKNNHFVKCVRAVAQMAQMKAKMAENP